MAQNRLSFSFLLNLSDQQKIRIGACAWSFEDWCGAFYPADLPDSHWLEFYARYLPAVEVDSTFYGAPAENTVRRWVEMTPAVFRFACKLPREITHACRLLPPRDRAARAKAPGHPDPASAVVRAEGRKASASEISRTTAARFSFRD